MNNRFLEFDLRRLILQYGKQNVIRALAQLGEQSQHELEQHLKSIEETRKAKHTKTKQRSIIELVEVECEKHPELANPLKELAASFENRTFLPQLRDVKLFLEQVGSSRRTVKSRQAAIPAVVRALVSLPKEELNRLAEVNDLQGESDFSLLAGAIMGKQEAMRETQDKQTAVDHDHRNDDE